MTWQAESATDSLFSLLLLTFLDDSSATFSDLLVFLLELFLEVDPTDSLLVGVLLDPVKDSFNGDSLVAFSSAADDAAAAAAEVAVLRPLAFFGDFLHM